MPIHIVIISYNNHLYVENTITQLININPSYRKDIIVFDNNSNNEDTKQYLSNLSNRQIKLHQSTSNYGPRINSHPNKEFYNNLSDQFVLTDPDLEFNKNIPSNFIEVLSKLSLEYNAWKIGFALKITDFDKMFQCKYFNNATIYEWEKQFWSKRIENDNFELYNADIDTTFCMVNKKGNENVKIRVAGNFTAKHHPWYPKDPILNLYEKYQNHSKQTDISTTSKIVMEYINKNYLKIMKNDQVIFIENDIDDPNLSFWKNIYLNWEKETFSVFDKYLDKNKIFIDIGGWIGTTCIYGARLSKRVITVEADRIITKYLDRNCKNNARNIECVNRAIYHTNGIKVCFDKNKFLPNSKLGDSTSQIINETDTEDINTIDTINIKTLIKEYDVDPKEISLIKVDIEGGEEDILEDLYLLSKTHGIFLYVSFHYSWWKDKNIDRFDFLSKEHISIVKQNPFTSLLLNWK